MKKALRRDAVFMSLALIAGVFIGMLLMSVSSSQDIFVALTAISTAVLAAAALYGLWSWRKEYELKRIAAAAESYLFSFHPHHQAAYEVLMITTAEFEDGGNDNLQRIGPILNDRLIKVQENLISNTAIAGLISPQFCEVQAVANMLLEDVREHGKYDAEFIQKAEVAALKCREMVQLLGAHIRLER